VPQTEVTRNLLFLFRLRMEMSQLPVELFQEPPRSTGWAFPHHLTPGRLDNRRPAGPTQMSGRLSAMGMAEGVQRLLQGVGEPIGNGDPCDR